MRKSIFVLLLISIFSFASFAQNSILEGYVFENGNNGYLHAVDVKIFKENDNQLLVRTSTDQYGFFITQLPAGVKYEIFTEKDRFFPAKTLLSVQFSDKNKKVFTKIKMFRQQARDKQGQFVTRSGTDLSKEVKEYGVDTKKINPNINQDGVTISQIVNNNRPYAEVTNATRLADTNYDKVSVREAMKRQPMLTAYKPDVKIDQTPIRRPEVNTSNIPADYFEGASSRKIITAQPRLGETVVASSNDRISTQRIPNYYTGYKIEFLTALDELPTTHEIFNRQGQIAMEQQPNGIYSYMLGNFRDRQSADFFLKEHLLEKYPMANIVFYDNGKRGQKVGQKRVKTKPVSAPPR